MEPIITNVGMAIHNGDWNWKNINSPFMRLYFVSEGTAKIRFSDGEYTLNSGHMYCIPAFVTHDCICNSSFRHYYIHIYFDQEGSISPDESLNFPFEVKGLDFDLQLFERLCQLNPSLKLNESNPMSYDNQKTLLHNIEVYQNNNLCDRIESKGITFQILSRFIKYATVKNGSHDERINQVLKYINIHLSEHLSTDLLSDIACLSKEYFIRLFKHHVGISPLKYVNKKRIEKAQKLLAFEHMLVKNVADSVGIEDYSYFNRIFKKITGMTPIAYRTNIQLQIQI